MLPQTPARGRIRRFVILAVLLIWPVAGCAAAGDGQVSTTPASASPQAAAAPPQAIWPSTEAVQLNRLHDLANRGQRPDLLDPVAVAKSYLTTALPSEVQASTALSGLAFTRFKPITPETGEVAVRGPRLSPSTVSLHQYAGVAGSGTRSSAKPIWYVQGLGSESLAVIDVDYDGTRLTGSLVPTRSGRITTRTSTLDGAVLAKRAIDATRGKLVDVGALVPDQPGLIFTAVLVAEDGTTALRAFRLGLPAPA